MNILRILFFAACALICSFASADGFLRASKTNPRYFEDGDGNTVILTALNYCFPRDFLKKSEVETFEGLEAAFKNMRLNGVNATRIWLSFPFFEVEEKRGEFSAEKFARIDRLIKIAKENGVRLKFCFENFRDIKGHSVRLEDPAIFVPPFDKPIYADKISNMEEFLTSRGGKEIFLARVREFAKRYADEPTIYAWELWNEVNSVRAPIDVYAAWTREMLIELKKLFPKQIVCQSLGSLSSPYVFAAYARVFRMKENEMAQVHRYFDGGSALRVCAGPLDVALADAVEYARGASVNVPVLISESGAVEPHHAGPSKYYLKDKDGAMLHDILFAPFFAGAAGTGQVWHWDFYVEKNSLWPHFKKFADFVKNSDPVKEEYSPYKFESGGLNVYVLSGKTEALVWVRDAKNDLISEFERGEAPRSVEGASLRIIDLAASAQLESVEFFDTWKDAHGTLKIENGKLSLPAFKRSCLLKIKFK